MLASHCVESQVLLVSTVFKYNLAKHLSSLIEWRPIGIDGRIAKVRIVYIVAGHPGTHNKVFKFICRLPIAHVIANIGACRRMHPKFMKGLIVNKLYAEVKTVVEHPMCNLQIIKQLWSPDDVCQIISQPHLQELMPYVLPLETISLKTGVECAMQSGVTNIADVLLALTYGGRPIRDFNVIAQLGDVSKLQPHLEICGFNYKLELLMCVDNQDDVFEHLLSNYNSSDLCTLVQNGWPTSHYLRGRILKLCFENNISHLISRPLKIIAHCMSTLCTFTKNPEIEVSNICVNVIDEIDGDTHRVCNVSMRGTLLFDISPLFLRQIMENDEFAMILPTLAIYPSCSAEYVDLFFTPTKELKELIITHSDVLQKMIPLVFPVGNDADMWSLIVDQWFNKYIDAATIFLFAYNGDKTRELTYPTDPAILFGPVVSYTPRRASLFDTLDRLIDQFSPGVGVLERALGRKEEMLAELSSFLPEGNDWKHPVDCCVCYEPHFGCLQTCRHPVCFQCYVKIYSGEYIVCPYCRTINFAYEFKTTI